MVTLDALRAEHKGDVVGALWLGEVRSMCRHVAANYSPAIYANGVSWNDELDDLVQEVVVDRLLAERQAHYLMDVSRDLSEFRRLLNRQVKITLAHRRRRTVVDQLLDRCRRILRASPYVRVRRGPDAWTLEGRSVPARGPTPRELWRAEHRVRCIPVVRGKGDQRAPTVYRSSDLLTLLDVVGNTLTTAFTLNDLDHIFTRLLTSFLPGILEGVGANELAPTEPESEEPEVSAAVAEMIESLDSEQRTIVAAKMTGVSDADVAASISVSRPTAAKRRAEAMQQLQPALAGLSESARTNAAARLGAELAGYWPPDGNEAQ